MCSSEPSLVALVYLQENLSSVTDHDDVEEGAMYRACMAHLLAGNHSSAATVAVDDGAGAADDELMATDDADRDYLASSQDFSAPQPRKSVNVDRRQVYGQRTALFESLLPFFPDEHKQPADDLLDSVVFD